MTIVAGDVCRVVAGMYCGSERYCNVYTTGIVSTTGVQPAQRLADLLEWVEGMYSSLENILANNLGADNLKVINVSQDLIEYDGEWPTWEGGQSADDFLPHGVAAVITAATDHVGTRARKFIPCLLESCQTEGYWTVPTMELLAVYATIWSSVWTGTYGSIWLAGVQEKGATFWTLADAIVRNVPGYQRRRKPGVGT